jgi:HlyD family secretion protein
VPTSALFRHGEGWAVFLVDGSVARRREVEVGARSPFEAEVRAGLAPGDRVVVHPSDRLADGVRVRAARKS